jgi:hypothetical protein
MIVSCVCEDSTINFLKSSNGVQLCCALLLDSRAAVLKCNLSHCMCLTMDGFIYVWKYCSLQYDNSMLNNAFNEPTITNLNSNFANRLKNNAYDTQSNYEINTLINQQSCQSVLRGK